MIIVIKKKKKTSKNKSSFTVYLEALALLSGQPVGLGRRVARGCRGQAQAAEDVGEAAEASGEWRGLGVVGWLVGFEQAVQAVAEQVEAVAGGGRGALVAGRNLGEKDVRFILSYELTSILD